jgi:protein-disulfide isomerase/rhodanese-related sulfurtransferase
MRKSILLALSLLGVFISGYLWWVYTSPSRPLVCLGTGCDVVRASRYASLAGLPLPIFGVAMYLVLVLLNFAETLVTSQLARFIRLATAGIAGLGFLFSLYLTGLEGFVIHAWCAWCVASAITSTLIFVLALAELIHPGARHDEAALDLIRGHFALLLVAVLLGAPIFYYLMRHGEMPSTVQASSEVLRERLIRPDSHSTGSPDAPVTVVEFGDFECPVCGRQEPVVQEVLRRYGLKIRFVFRQFPLETVHMEAMSAAQASECAAAQGKFWEAEHKLYENQLDLSEGALDRYAAELGLDKASFSQCLSSHAMEARIRRDMADGLALGVNATPTFFIDQQKFARPIDFAEFSQLLDHELVTRASATPGTTAGTTTGHGPAQSASSGSGQDTSPTDVILPGSGSSAFANLPDSAMTCSNDEAKRQQPDLIRTLDARHLFEGAPKPVFVDVRTAKEFGSGHIPAAINVPVDEFERRFASLPKNQTVVLYESGKSPGDICGASRAAGRVLLAHGLPHEQVKVYQDGLADWQKSGLPVER